ncbi:MAG TPA: ABC transporter permease [Candidatus Polarisedimenticolaceae bacterium]|nr:ABC transporter permease [Candidatus Polarisedimenticolaceae bacterium]
MNLTGALRQVGRDFRSQKLRSFLTTFGIVWGTAGVSLLLAFGQAFQHQMEKEQAGLGDAIVIAWPSLTSIPYQGLGRGRPIRVTEEDIDLIESRCRGLGAISSEYMQGLKLQNGKKTLSVDVSGVRPSFGEMRNLIPQRGGRFLNAWDEQGKRRVAFLGDELAQQLFGGGGAVGQTLRLHGSTFTVIGVMERKNQDSSYSGRDKEKIFVPASTMRALTGAKYVDDFVFTARDVTRTKPVSAEIVAILGGRHRFDPQDKEAVSLWDTTEGAQFFATFMFGFRLFLGIVGSLTLVAGGIGVSNIMNVVVEERTGEIGVKLALGARPRWILRQFLAETLLVTLLGGVLGMLITAGICAAFPAFGLEEYVGRPAVSSGVAASTAALLGAIGLLAGYFPARTASRLDPVVAMKL